MSAKTRQDAPAPIPTVPEPLCRRCGECASSDHHWIDTYELTQYSCKHCPAIGEACPDCSDGDAGEGPEYRECPRCGGEGVIELVEITRAEVDALRRDRERLRLIERIGLAETGESTVGMIDELIATAVRPAGRRAKRAPAHAPGSGGRP